MRWVYWLLLGCPICFFADNGQQTTDNRQRTTDNRQQTTDNRQRTTDNGQQITYQRLSKSISPSEDVLRVSISTSVGVAAWELIPTFRPEMHNGELFSISVTSALGVIYVFFISVFVVVWFPLSVVRSPLSVVCCPLSVVRCLLSVVCCPLSFFIYTVCNRRICRAGRGSVFLL